MWHEFWTTLSQIQNMTYKSIPPALTILAPVVVLIAWTTVKLWGIGTLEALASMGMGVPFRKIARWTHTQALEGPVLARGTGIGYDNTRLLDAPIIFYMSSFIFAISGTTTYFDVAAAWLYVGIRIAHSISHIMGGNRMSQLCLVLCSSIVLITIVTNLVISVV
jgi:hypothetical protein